MKKLIPALCLLLVTAVIVGTSSYAWFSMSNIVTAKGMQVTAVAGDGLVIKATSTNVGAELGEQNWATTSDVAALGTKSLKSVSTVDTANWYTAEADKYDDACANQAKEKYTEVTSSLSDYYAQYTYAIRAAASDRPIENVKLGINKVEVTQPTTQASAYLNKSIRVAVKVGDTVYVYAPLAAADVTMTPKYGTGEVTLVAKKSATAANDTFTLTDNKVPAADNVLSADVFVYYEGEDTTNKSSNVKSTIDELSVSVEFTTVAVTTGGDS